VKPFCYTTNRGKRWEYCNCKKCNQKPTKPSPTEGPPTSACSQTASGRKCQKWNESYPNQPNSSMVNRVIQITGSSNHNKCTHADENDPKTWCYTVDPKKRWEHCSPFCTDDKTFTQRPPTGPLPGTIHPATGTRVQDVPEEKPQIDPRSKYDQLGNCIENCKSRSLSALFGQQFRQCGSNGEQCLSARPHVSQVISWSVPEASECTDATQCSNIIGEKFFNFHRNY